MTSRPAPTLKENRISDVHGRQLQIYTVYPAHEGGYRVKDRWGHSSDWDGFGPCDTKEEAIEKAKERARDDRPAMVQDRETGNVWRYPLRKKDIPDEIMGDEITDEERKQMREELMNTEYDTDTHQTVVRD